MPRCPRCPDVWAKRKHPGRPDTKPDGLHPGCLDIWASGLLPSLHPGIRLLASSGQGQTSGSSWRAWTPAQIQVHLGEPRRGLNGPIRASGLAWFVWPETPGCTVMFNAIHGHNPPACIEKVVGIRGCVDDSSGAVEWGLWWRALRAVVSPTLLDTNGLSLLPWKYLCG